jgi:hypothetical protein
MFNFLSSVFYGVPSTKSYEAKLHSKETKYAVYLETLESEEFRKYNELKAYLADPENLKVKADLLLKERQLKKDYQEKVEKLRNKAISQEREYKEKKLFILQQERQQKKDFLQKKHSTVAESKEEHRILLKQLKDQQRQLGKQIATNRYRLKQEGINLKQALKMEDRTLKDEYSAALRQVKVDLQQQKDEIKYFKREFKTLKNSKTIITFFVFKKKYSKIIEEQERWVLKFFEDFSKNEIDARWSNKQVISELLINGAPYSPIEDQHIFSSDNLQQSGGILKLKTKREAKQGLAWDKTYGLLPKTFSYTSGLLNSSHSFRQMYGRFEAKVRVKHIPGTYHAFWMGTDTKKPHLNIFKFEDRHLQVSAYAGDTTIERKLKYKLKDDFYIYTLLWNKDKLTWLINGKKVFESSNIINEPMYISFSSGVYDKTAEPTTMYIEWIRCFRSN